MTRKTKKPRQVIIVYKLLQYRSNRKHQSQVCIYRIHVNIQYLVLDCTTCGLEENVTCYPKTFINCMSVPD